ncbi:glutathione S-transferase family protein [Phenylobacterium sp.]|uniref:glutathione S-transferase family protein n=1 Tax=Phenylobacterium sp. TaxID=1871053 RepID=UPI0011FA7F86|nr:glutathione S-transferase family protein [Phenylobacterium sp.]THD58974.1 MAG: glutathione S-transferase family protein [Phenylobacterium sp.]
MDGGYVLYGAPGSGSVAVEAALTLIGAPWRLEDAKSWKDVTDSDEMARVNPMRQVPALILPSGDLMTESAAILTWLADSHPGAGLAPAIDSSLRPRFLRWMSFISAQIYSLYWVRDVPSRLASGAQSEAVIKDRTAQRIADCYRTMDAQVAPAGRFLLGDEVSVLDLYLTVVSRWGPRRKGFYAAAPGLAEVVRAVDAEPRLAALWAERFPFSEGWEG